MQHHKEDILKIGCGRYLIEVFTLCMWILTLKIFLLKCNWVNAKTAQKSEFSMQIGPKVSENVTPGLRNLGYCACSLRHVAMFLPKNSISNS